MTVPQPPQVGQKSKVPEVWGNKVPQRNMNFTGREDLLAELRAGISANVTAVVPHALHGFGGVGKTQIALEYAYRYRSEYDLVWWISADQPVLVRSSLAGLAPYLGLQDVVGAGIQEAVTAVLQALRRGEPYDNWLLIFDNADQPEDINDIIPRGPGHVLITSRNHRWQGVVGTIPVDVFDRTESIDFLNKRIPKAIATPDAERLAQELGDLPLALEQAGALQAETGMSADEYLTLLRDQASQLLAESKPSEYPVSMTAAWALSVSKLKDRMPEAVELLRCCAFFGPEPIPRDVFSQGRVGSDGSKIGNILANPIILARALRELGRFALARIDSPARTIQVHRLIQALLRDELSPEEQDAFRREVHYLLVGAAPKSPDNAQDWERYADLVGHVAPSGVADNRDSDVRGFALNVVRYLYASGNYYFSRSFAESFLERWVDVSGADHRDVLVAQRNLGNVLRELGEYRRAYQINSETIEKMRCSSDFGPEHVETLRTINSFGADLRARGEFAAAREHDEDSRQRHERVLGETSINTLRAMNNLSLDYGLISDYQKARELHLETYRRLQQAKDVEAMDRLNSWMGLSRAVRLCGDYTEACDLGEDAYEYALEMLGAQHSRTLHMAKDLSIAQRRAGRHTQARELAQDAHTRLVRLFGEDHPDTLAAAMNLANTMRTMGEIDAAYELAETTMERYPKVYGDEHPYNHGCASNLALLRRVRGDVAGARELNERSLKSLDAKLTRDHHYSLTVAMNLASDLAALGKATAARELGEDSLERAREVLGPDHPLTLGCAANLVIDLRADGADDKADELAADTLNRYNRTLGPEHPDTKVAALEQRLDFDFDPPPI